MEYYLSAILFFFFGAVYSFFDASTESLTSDDIDSAKSAGTDTAGIEKLRSAGLKGLSALMLGERFFFAGGVSLSVIASFVWFDSSITAALDTFAASSCAAFVLHLLSSAVGEKFAPAVTGKFAGAIYFLQTLFMPFALFSDKVHNLVNSGEKDTALEEIDELVENAREDGSIDAGEYKLFKNVIKFSDVLVTDVMTPRTVVFALPADITVGEALSNPELQTYSRIPIYNGESLDAGACGYVMSKDIMRAVIKGAGGDKLSKFARELTFIPENASLDAALDTFLSMRSHMFLVVDEYGGIEGLLSMEDVLETILGSEIIDEADGVADLRELAKLKRDRRVMSAGSKPEEA